MLEGLCRPNIYDKCRSITGREPVVFRKGMIPHWEYDGFYKQYQDDRFSVYEKGYVKKLMRQPGRSPMRMAASLFSRKGEVICEGYIRDKYGDWETAIKKSGTFSNLIEDFEAYFKERKEQFMKKTDDIIAQMPKQLTKVGQIKTSSHGGVANLLKVLTKTMHEQGSSIRTIARVQYAICCQAGLYIPEEFITDVLVAADINPDVMIGE